MENKPKIVIVVPCYNEQEVLPETHRRLGQFLSDNADVLSPDSRVLFVNDGSRDDTWKLIKEFSAADERFEGICFAHNAGHQNALWAGMDAVKDDCDAVITIDADLQDDIGAMRGFVEEMNKGADVVYGVRSSRKSDTAFKRLTAEGFYRLMDALGVETVFNHADYRLLSRRALKALMEYGESNLFLRGMVPTLGFTTAKVYYERHERFAGESKYPLKKMLAFAFQGITSFSVKPLRLIWILGLLCALLSCLLGLILLIVPGTQAGFTAFSVWFMGGLVLAALGLVGEYVGKVYGEVKHRPRYIIMESTRREDR